MADFPNIHATINVRRTLIHSTSIYEGDSGKEAPTSWLPAPKYRYELEIEFLEAGEGKDMEALLGFMDTKFGRLGHFTFNDPLDGVDRLVRFDMDELAYERFMSNLWSIATLTLITVPV